MENLFESTKRFLAGKIKTEEYVSELQYVYEYLRNLTSGLGANSLSFLENARSGISHIIDASEEETKLRMFALICDIVNNFRHSLQFRGNFKDARKIDDARNVLSGIKKTMIIEITQECKKHGNNSYGFSIDDKGIDVFAVDIPTCGQISWHMPGKMGIIAKYYEHELERKTIHVNNMGLLCLGLKKQSYDSLSEHSKAVIDSQDIEEMNEKLKEVHTKTKNTLDLSHLVNPPSEEDLKIGGVTEEQEKDIKVPGEE